MRAFWGRNFWRPSLSSWSLGSQPITLSRTATEDVFTYSGTSSAAPHAFSGAIPISVNKWYAEFRINWAVDTLGVFLGLVRVNQVVSEVYPGRSSVSIAFAVSNNSTLNRNVWSSNVVILSTALSFANNDIMGVRCDGSSVAFRLISASSGVFGEFTSNVTLPTTTNASTNEIALAIGTATTGSNSFSVAKRRYVPPERIPSGFLPI